ncbi:Hemicentin-1 [Desmophyllum pertusum]|uniref:Hemicentin-1 n=1 Tax=Desmophyllum pertusum TaxID=174260 RepID=A0A9W9Y9P8_9CNID|nr:Hemicentin-1 [Desmophyllum pertusum]
MVEDMLINVIKARRLLSSSSDFLQLKVLVAKIDDDLDTISRVFDLLVAQLQPYRNRTSIETAISSFIRLQRDIPKTISLSFSKSSIHQNFVGVRFALIAQVCHKRLCFANIKCNIWSVQDNSCVTNLSRQEAGVIIEGTVLRDISLGNVITYPVGRPFKMLISRHSQPFVTTFECLVDLLGLKRNTTIKMIGRELFFSIWGPMFGNFEALLNVKADFENVVDWKSIVFEVEGTMNRSSNLYTMLESMIANETAMAAKEVTTRLAKAQATFNDAKIKADVAKGDLKLKQTDAEELRIEKERAAKELRVARLQYQLAKVSFDNTMNFRQNIQSFVCEIKECNYTCLNGCVIPDLCQNPINITYLERYCELVNKPITINVVQQSIEKRSFAVQTRQKVYTGDCKSVMAASIVGGIVGGISRGIVGGISSGILGGIVGGVAGAAIGVLSKILFGCSDTYEWKPGEPRLVEYDHKVFEMKGIEKIIKEVECTGQEEKTKRGGYGPPYPCCKKYGCKAKVIDPRCVINNDECLGAMTELKVTLDAMNATFQSAFLSLRNSVDKVKKATYVYEKARIRHAFAVSLLNKVKSHTEQRLSAVEIVNASMLHVRRIVDVGLKIAQAINASNSDNKKTVDVGDLKFSFSMASQDMKKILVRSNVSSSTGQQTSVSFLVDFDQVERSITSASKTIIAKYFGGEHARKRRSATEGNSDSAHSTHSLHTSFTDYPYACLVTNTTHLYLRSIFQSLGDLISSVKRLNVNLSSGFHDLEKLAQTVNASSPMSNASSVNISSGYPNSSFVTEYMEMIKVLKDESTRLTNDSSQSWNDTLETWRAFLEVFTSNKGFEECSGTEDCIDYFFEGAKEFYEFEDSPRALEIKNALPQLREVIKSLTTEDLAMPEAEKALRRAVLLLNKTRDDSVLCGETPHITSSSQKEVILLPGDSLFLNCTAESEAGLKYAWKKNDQLFKESIDGTFYEHSVSKQDEGAYVCVVSNNKGSSLSNVTIVKVHSRPRITQHPKPQRVVLGSQMSATFICNGTGQPAPSFQWFFQSTNSAAIKINETKPVLYMTNPRRHHEGYYYCEVSNKHGAAVSQRARLDVLGYTIGLPRLLVVFNLTSHCWLTSNSSNSSVQDPLQCDSDSMEELPPSTNKNLTGDILDSLARSLNVSLELISGFEYDSRNTPTATVAFIVDIDKEPWKEDNFTSYVDIVEAIAIVGANLFEKLEQFNSDILNKTFKVPWNNSVLLGDPGSLMAYPLSPQCPEGQSLRENGYICANCPAGLSYNTENETCVECPLGSYQPVQGQTECIPCGKKLTTAFNGTVEEADCIEIESPSSDIPVPATEKQSTVTTSGIHRDECCWEASN